MPAGKSFIASPAWSRIIVPFAELETDGSDIQAMMFADVAVPGPFSFTIDDVRLEP